MHSKARDGSLSIAASLSLRTAANILGTSMQKQVVA